MRNEIIQKGAELGLWDAESLMAEKEAEDSKGTVSFGGGSILEAPIIDAARRDPFALGSFCLGSALLIGGAFGPEETVSGGAKDKMIKVSNRCDKLNYYLLADQIRHELENYELF